MSKFVMVIILFIFAVSVPDSLAAFPAPRTKFDGQLPSGGEHGDGLIQGNDQVICDFNKTNALYREEKFIAFISYRIAPSRHLAMLIKIMLRNHRLNAFLDVNNLGGGFWDEQLVEGVKKSPNFILILSNGTLDRAFNDPNYEDVMHQEIKLAVDEKKRIIPVFDDGFTFPPEHLISPQIKTALRFQGVKWIHGLADCSTDKIIKYFTTKRTSSLSSSPESYNHEITEAGTSEPYFPTYALAAANYEAEIDKAENQFYHQ